MLSKAPGIGKKTAQRIILELKDKVDDDELKGMRRAAVGGEVLKRDAAGEAVEALMALGYQSSEAARAVASLSPMPGTVDEIIRQALKGMMA